MRPRVHLCIADADAGLATLLLERLVNPVSGLLVEPWSARGHFDGSQADRVRAVLTGRIVEAEVVACMVGPAAHTDRWVGWELETSVAHGRGVVAIRLRTGIGDFMPAQVLRAVPPVVDAHPQSVIAALERIAFTKRSRPENK